MKSIKWLICGSMLTVATLNLAFADANTDNATWVAQCVSDNKDEGQTVEVISKYCTCMNDKMPNEESLSISAWEKKHPKEEEACAKTAHWVNK